MQTYQNRFDKQIAPYFGEVKVQELNTISAAHAFIHNALKYAMYPAQLISSNPVIYIKVPKNAPRNVIKRHIVSPEHFKALRGKYPFGTPPYIPLMLLYHIGMQIKLICGGKSNIKVSAGISFRR